MYAPRDYRQWVNHQNLVAYSVQEGESDLYIATKTDLSAQSHRLLTRVRSEIAAYIEGHPKFATELTPLSVEPDSPVVIRRMAAVSILAGVGPMAAVAGAVAEYLGESLRQMSPEVIIENGGDIYIHGKTPRTVAIYAGKSPLSGRIALKIGGGDAPVGICTSSGTVGHSLSFGRTDAAATVAGSSTLADAAATAIGNAVKVAGDIEAGLELARRIDGIRAALIIVGEKFGIWGDAELVKL